MSKVVLLRSQARQELFSTGICPPAPLESSSAYVRGAASRGSAPRGTPAGAGERALPEFRQPPAAPVYVAANEPKEYIIGAEVFKPTSYDPQKDASVRVQIGLL